MKPCPHSKKILLEERKNEKGEIWYRYWCQKCKTEVVTRRGNLKLDISPSDH